MTNTIDDQMGNNFGQPILDQSEVHSPEDVLKKIIRTIVTKTRFGTRRIFRKLKRVTVHMIQQWEQGARIHAQVSTRGRMGNYYHFRGFC
jgi:hypothetical protein